jgi:hypothetical protein
MNKPRIYFSSTESVLNINPQATAAQYRPMCSLVQTQEFDVPYIPLEATVPLQESLIGLSQTMQELLGLWDKLLPVLVGESPSKKRRTFTPELAALYDKFESVRRNFEAARQFVEEQTKA